MYWRWLVSLSILVTSLRAARIITYNTYDPKDALYTALLLDPPLSCEHYNETLYDIKFSNEARKALRNRLSCDSSTRYVYVASTDKDACLVYDSIDDQTLLASCKQDYPSLCTNSAPKRTFDTLASRDQRFSYHVRSRYGRVLGTRTNLAFEFLGLPYAFPPVGDLRFKPPVCVARIGRTWNATSYRSFCPQGKLLVGNAPLNEDCLYLNVYTPYIPEGRDTKDMLLPVMFWIHGGAFVQGDVSNAIFDPSNFVSRENIVVVTMNYRLGALGFWAGGNQGIRDQILALEWVNRNIETYGGDPKRITIAGESAGANSVRALLSAHKKTEGLFSAAVLASDVLNVGYSTKEDAVNILSHRMAKTLGCATDQQKVDEKKVMDCMRKVPVKQIVGAQDEVGAYAVANAKSIIYSEIYTPTIDHDLIDQDFYVAMRKGDFVKVPTMLGFLQDEGYYFIMHLFPVPLTKNAFTIALGILFSETEIKAILDSKLYDSYMNDTNTDNVRLTLANMLTHFHWTCPSQLVMSRLSEYTKVYGYYSTYPYLWLHPDSTLCHNHVCHTDDILSFMAGLSIPGIHKGYFSTDSNIKDTDAVYLRMFSSRLASFIKYHDPNPKTGKLCDKDYYPENYKHGKMVTWDAFKPNETLNDVAVKFGKETKLKVFGNLHVFNLQESTVLDGVERKFCEFWLKLGFHTQTQFDYSRKYLREKVLRAMESYKYH